MKFETLIWIVIVGVYMLAFILKRIISSSRRATPKPTGRPPEWKKKLDRYLAQIRQEMGTPPQEATSEQTGWERVMPRAEEEPDAKTGHPLEGPPAEPRPARRPPGWQTAPPAVTKEHYPERPKVASEKKPRGTERPVQHGPAWKTKPVEVSGIAPRPKTVGFGVSELRKAVIWSEILAPPLALRDP